MMNTDTQFHYLYSSGTLEYCYYMILQTEVAWTVANLFWFGPKTKVVSDFSIANEKGNPAEQAVPMGFSIRKQRP